LAWLLFRVASSGWFFDFPCKMSMPWSECCIICPLSIHFRTDQVSKYQAFEAKESEQLAWLHLLTCLIDGEQLIPVRVLYRSAISVLCIPVWWIDRRRTPFMRNVTSSKGRPSTLLRGGYILVVKKKFSYSVAYPPTVISTGIMTSELGEKRS
jgi:hypothetical protein